MLPINKQLTDPKIDKNAASTKSLLTTWNKRHAVRSVLGSLAFIISTVNVVVSK